MSETKNTLKVIERDENGLIKGINYKFNDQGFIDWRSMVSPEFLYVNPDTKRRDKLEKKYNKKYEEIDPILDNVEDVDLIIMLGGLKQILRIKGFTNVNFWIKEANKNFAAVSCTIDFLPSYESEGKELSYSENACAHQGNTMSFAKNYLLEIATNRALARCIRNACGINIVSREEMQGSNSLEEEQPKSSSQLLQPAEILSKLLKDKNISFNDAIKGIKGNETWKEIKDIPNATIFSIIGKLKLNR